MSKNSCSAAAALAAIAALSGASRQAHAQGVPDCSTLTLPHPIYGAGGSAITADLKQVGIKLSGLPSPITVLFADAGGACVRFADYLKGSTTSTFKYWTSDGKENQCNPPLTGQALDFSHMGNPADACPADVVKPADVGDFTGPIQTVNVITAAGSTQQSISQEAAYFVLGWGDQSQAAPWTNAAHIALRSATAAVSSIISAATGVPANKFKGATPVYSTNADVVAAVAGWAPTNVEDPIGYVSGSAADAGQKAGTIKTLAFQAKDQTCAYWPDSTQTAKDKKNVRNGLYNIWTPGHFFAKFTGNKATVANIVNPDVKNLIGWYRDEIDPPAGIDVVALTITAGDVPQCAMHVTRAGLLGAVSSWASATPCDCFFDKTAIGQTSCTVCDATDTNACGGKPSHCRHGYCEDR